MTVESTDVSKADLVHRRLREEIELGELAPGAPLLCLGGSPGSGHRSTILTARGYTVNTATVPAAATK